MNRFNMITKAGVAAALVFAAGAASAQTSTQNVSVAVALTSQCRLETSTPATLTVDFGTYTAFQTGDATPATPPTLTLECTRNFSAAPSIAWDTTNGSAAGAGTVKGLAYTLDVGTPTTAAGTAATATVGATPKTHQWTVTGTIVSGQAGDASASGTSARTMTITW